MNKVSRARLKEERRYKHLYALAPSERSDDGYNLCVYCGMPADTHDHVPPLSRIEDYRALRVDREMYLRVRSCRDCNIKLGDSLQSDIIERISELKEKLSKKRGKLREFSIDLWVDDDFDELGPNLRTHIMAGRYREEILKQRIAYMGGLRAILIGGKA